MLDYHLASLAKFAADFFRMSRSLVTRASSFFSRLVSSASSLPLALDAANFVFHSYRECWLRPRRRRPETAVLTWLDAQAIETLFISASSIAELRFGVASMPTGKRQAVLHDRLEGEVLLPLFDGRILPFNAGASEFYADLMASGNFVYAPMLAAVDDWEPRSGRSFPMQIVCGDLRTDRNAEIMPTSSNSSR